MLLAYQHSVTRTARHVIPALHKQPALHMQPGREQHFYCSWLQLFTPCTCDVQVAGLKDKLAVVLSKTQNDDKLIAVLRKELVAATGGKAGIGRYGSAVLSIVSPTAKASAQGCQCCAQHADCRPNQPCCEMRLNVTNNLCSACGHVAAHHFA